MMVISQKQAIRILKRPKEKANDPVLKRQREIQNLFDDLLDEDKEYQKEKREILRDAGRKLLELRSKYFKKYIAPDL